MTIRKKSRCLNEKKGGLKQIFQAINKNKIISKILNNQSNEKN
jgi:hypothetical protein